MGASLYMLAQIARLIHSKKCHQGAPQKKSILPI